MGSRESVFLIIYDCRFSFDLANENAFAVEKGKLGCRRWAPAFVGIEGRTGEGRAP